MAKESIHKKISLRSKRSRLVSEQTTKDKSQKPLEKNWLSFHFSRCQNRKCPSSVFLYTETKRKRLLRRLQKKSLKNFSFSRILRNK